MNLEEFRKTATDLHILMDDRISGVTDAAASTQARVARAIMAAINDFELNDGRFVANQDFTARFLALEQRIEKLLGRYYQPAVREYAKTYKTIEDTTLGLAKDYSQLQAETSQYSPIRKASLLEAQQTLIDAANPAYIKPIEYTLMQQVASGADINETRDIIQKWNKDGLRGERVAPTLERYATQIARDGMYKYQGTLNEKLATDFGLTDFIYVGGVISDTRPLCRHLVGLKRTISLDEMPKLVAQFPEGTYPDTTKKNFIQVCGGYSCRHSAQPVRKRT